MGREWCLDGGRCKGQGGGSWAVSWVVESCSKGGELGVSGWSLQCCNEGGDGESRELTVLFKVCN